MDQFNKYSFNLLALDDYEEDEEGNPIVLYIENDVEKQAIIMYNSRVMICLKRQCDLQ